MPSSWNASQRSLHYPPDWRQLRLTILARDGRRCTAVDRGHRCHQKATDVDHIRPQSLGGTDDPANLTSLCGWHHARKSSAEGNAARIRPTERRPSERHPGSRAN
jgi:5-methylcytosine-specific restriction protein A